MRETPLIAQSDQERLEWLRLIRSENVGPMTFFRLLEQFGSAGEALSALPDLARKGGQRNYRLFSREDAEAELKALENAGAFLVGYTEPEYPPLLRAVDGAPPLISVKGATHLLARTTIAVVGARNASANGLGFARKLAADLGRGGFGVQNAVVASGLARGIDAAAHQGALESGTIAVLAGGIDKVYPAENALLHDEIAERGVLLAEMPVGTQPTGRLFPVRNRIISGLSRGVVVVEASPRSGSLITARNALDQGREVFAVPGAPGDPRTQGTNGLIRDGAMLTESATDVLRALGEGGALLAIRQYAFDFNIQNPSHPDQDSMAGGRPVIMELLGFSPVAVDELVRNCQFSIATVSAILLELELAGRLERHPGNRVSLVNEQ